MSSLKQIGQDVIKRKGLKEVFVTSDGVPFLKLELAQKHAIKNRLQIEKIVKPKKTVKDGTE